MSFALEIDNVTKRLGALTAMVAYHKALPAIGGVLAENRELLIGM